MFPKRIKLCLYFDEMDIYPGVMDKTLLFSRPAILQKLHDSFETLPLFHRLEGLRHIDAADLTAHQNIHDHRKQYRDEK